MFAGLPSSSTADRIAPGGGITSGWRGVFRSVVRGVVSIGRDGRGNG